MNAKRGRWDGAGARILLVFICGLLGGCTTFNDEWKAARAQPADPQDITGSWQGKWQSSKNNHQGGLLCIVHKVSDTEYTARFRAHYWQTFHHTYTVPLRVWPAAEQLNFEGDANLGCCLGGVFHYQGHANGQRMYADYSARQDLGWFELKRPGAAPSTAAEEPQGRVASGN